MRKFFTSRLFAVLILIGLLCLGSVLYSAASGHSNPVVAVLNMAVSPIQKGVRWVTATAAHGAAYFTEYDALVEENERLKTALREAEQKNRDAQVALDENDRLRSLLGIKERNRSFTFEVAEVIARAPGDWERTLTLDKGTAAGVSEDDLVITKDGVVGYVSEAALNYCEVTTVIDTGLQMGALITRTREVAIAEGDYDLMDKGALRLSYLKQDADIVIGDTVETSGRGGLFPKGMMIGTIEQILPEEHGISNYAVVRPFVDPETVSHVFIIKEFEVTE